MGGRGRGHVGVVADESGSARAGRKQKRDETMMIERMTCVAGEASRVRVGSA